MRMNGLCECGCGTSTRLAPFSDRTRRWVRGQPIRFIRGHSTRLGNEQAKGGRKWTAQDNECQRANRAHKKDEAFCTRLLARLRHDPLVKQLYRELAIRDLIESETSRYTHSQTIPIAE